MVGAAMNMITVKPGNTIDPKSILFFKIPLGFKNALKLQCNRLKNA